MTKTELVDEVEEKTGLTKKDTGKVIDTSFEAIMDYLGEEAEKPEDDRDNVQIMGFGKFEVRNRAEKKGRNPQTGEEITIPERKVPVFKYGDTFKKQVNNYLIYRTGDKIYKPAFSSITTGSGGSCNELL